MDSKSKSVRSAKVTGVGVIGLVLAGVGAAAIVGGARRPSPEIAQVPTLSAPLPPATPEPLPSQPAAAPTSPAQKTAAKTTAAPKAAARSVKPAPKAVAKSVLPAPKAVAPSPETKTASIAEIAFASEALPVEPAPRIATQEAAPVTITGCLERDADTFRLKNTSGTDAPRSRSWKSGFLRKGAASIEVVDAARVLNLSNHVGRRISVSGTLVDREMQVRSVQRVAATCG